MMHNTSTSQNMQHLSLLLPLKSKYLKESQEKLRKARMQGVSYCRAAVTTRARVRVRMAMGDRVNFFICRNTYYYMVVA